MTTVKVHKMATANNEDNSKEYKFPEQFLSFNSKIESFRTKEFPRLKGMFRKANINKSSKEMCLLVVSLPTN